MTKVVIGKSVYRYAQKTFDDRYFKDDGVDFYIYALLVSRKKPGPEGLKFSNPKNVPREIVRSLDEEQREEAQTAARKGNLWFLKLEGKGWDWTKQSGHKGARAVQEALNYLKRFKSKDRVGGVEAVYVEINNKKRRRKASTVRTAGWWGHGPLEGDTSLDLLDTIQRRNLSPEELSAFVTSLLKGEHEWCFTPSECKYSGMGLWDYISTTGEEQYKRAMAPLKRLVQLSAQEVLNDTEWLDSWYNYPGPIPFLELYEEGEFASASFGELHGEPFYPGDRTWYIDDAQITYYSPEEIEVLIYVRKGQEEEEIRENLPGPSDAVDVFDVSTDNYGGEGIDQQSVVVTIDYENEDGESLSADAQIDIDPETGEVKDISLNWDY